MVFLRCYAKVTDWIYEVFNHAPAADYRFLPIHMYGFWVAVGFFVAASLAALEMRRREKLGLMPGIKTEVTIGDAPKTGEMILYFVISFVVLFKVIGFISYQPELSTNLALSDYLFSFTYGSWLGGVLGAAAVAGWYYYSTQKQQLPKPQTVQKEIFPSDNIGDLVVMAAFFGVAGAVLFNFFESPEPMSQQLQRLRQDPLGFFTSGLSVYGGLICAGASFAIYAYKKRIHIGRFFDSIAPGFILANGIGRIGCHTAGDGDWGVSNIAPKPDWMPQWLWGNHYEHNIINEGVPIPGCLEEHCHMLAQPAYPTPIYEFMMCAAVFLILWALRKRLTYKPGMIFTIFLILIGIQRFSIEQWRDLSGRQLYHFFGMGFRQSELISIALFTIGVAATAYLYNRYRKNPPAASGNITS